MRDYVVRDIDPLGRVDLAQALLEVLLPPDLVELQVRAGVHGVGVALGSEIRRLTEPERVQVTRTVVQKINGRVPVVVNTSGAGTEQAVYYGRLAQENGADALMVYRHAWEGTPLDRSKIDKGGKKVKW